MSSQINRAMEEMVKKEYPEAVASRHAEQAKAQATESFIAMVFSAEPDPLVLQVGLYIYSFGRHLSQRRSLRIVIGAEGNDGG